MKRFLPIILSLSVVLILILYLSFRFFEFFSPFLPFTNYLLGVEKPTSYLVLLGNDAEMRANGGFAGSYAKAVIARSETTKQSPRRGLLQNFVLRNDEVVISFQDIYVPNGQIKGLYVAPPDPIQQAFGHGTWELANADWDPDFPTAAKSLRWFLEKGGETNPDILAILNLSTIKKIVDLVGSFSVPEYRATLTPDNLYLFLQGKAELNFFPGSTQKKDALTAVGGALVKKIKSLSFIQKLHIAQILYTDFINQNIMVHSTNSSFQSFLEQEKLAGVFQSEAFDTYAMIETNLGANKANAFVTRQTTHTISFLPPALSREGSGKGSVSHQINIQFQNSSIEANPNPPLHYGGNYIAYLRLYVPENAQNISLTRDPEGKPPLDLKVPPVGAIHESPAPSPKESPRQVVLQGDSLQDATIKISYGLTEIGFWHTTLAGNQSTVSLTYDLPVIASDSVAIQAKYTLAILKQHGQLTSPQTLNLFGKTYSSPLTSNLYYP